jgi:hypothetical protein
MGIEELKEEALQLDAVSRAELARTLLASLDDLSEAERARLWIEEALGREDDLNRGAAQAYPVEDVLARARARRK